MTLTSEDSKPSDFSIICDDTGKLTLPKSVIDQVMKQYNLIGVGYKPDPEIQEVSRYLKRTMKFLSSRCVGDPINQQLRSKIRTILDQIELYRKIPNYTSEHHPDGLYEMGYKYWWQEVQAIKKYPLIFKEKYNLEVLKK